MDKIVFNDGVKIVSYDDGLIKEYPCDFYTRYLSNSIRQAEKDAIFHTGIGAEFRGDAIENLKRNQLNENIRAEITDLYLTGENTLNYSLFINDLSAIHTKDLTLEKDSESHVIHDNGKIFKGASEKNGKIITTVSSDLVTSHLAVFDKSVDDYSLITDGDCFDATPRFSAIDDNKIIFSSKGVGRDGNGNFVEYSPSSIYEYDLSQGNVNEIRSSSEYSYTLPKNDKFGNLYAIKKPIKEKKRSNILLDILLIPYRLITAIYYFLESFTRSFTGKTFTENSPYSNNPAKTKKGDERKIFIDGNEIYADKEYKNNLKHKDDFAGIIPRGYELVKITENGDEVIRKGIISYEILSNGTIVASNGKYILKIVDGKVEKLCSANLATTISSIKKV